MLIALVLGLLCAASGTTRAGAGDPYVVQNSLQTFERNGESVRALRIPVYITLRSWEERSFGLRLRVAASFAAADIFELLEEADFTQVNVLSFVPGMEFVVPVGRHSMLRPFFDAGVGTENATDRASFLGAIGLRTEFLFLSGRNIFGLEPGFQLNLSSGSDSRSRSTMNPFISTTVRHTFGFRVGGYLPDAGAYFDAGYNFQTFEFSSLTADSKVNTNLELGVDLGFSRGRPKIGPFRIPRLRVGYRFGDLEGFRIRLGGDWLTTVAEQRDAESRESSP